MAAGAVLAAILALGGLGMLLLADGSPDEPADDVRACVPRRAVEPASTEPVEPCPPAGAKPRDGLVRSTRANAITLQVIARGEPGDVVTFRVRRPDRPYIDIEHLQTHAARRQPVRIYTKRVDGREAVVYVEDARLVRRRSARG